MALGVPFQSAMTDEELQLPGEFHAQSVQPIQECGDTLDERRDPYVLGGPSQD